jgi:presenilin-like A22 family membrane protease
MKHNLQITIILLAMFIVTQFIGLYVVDHYSSVKVVNGNVINVSAPSLPFGLETPEVEKDNEFYIFLPSIILAFIIAIFLVFLLSKIKAEFILKLWFFVVVMIALGISLYAFLPSFKYSTIIILAIVFPLAFIKIYKRNFLVHNLTELFVYPGIAAIFVPILNIWTIIALLIIISIYDVWAVWHSGIMQKMAKYQINKLKIFSGFFVPYISKKLRIKLKEMRKSQKGKKSKKKIKVNIAILGGGDVIFPIITAGVMLKTLGLIPALFVIIGATLGLSYLFFFAAKKKFYPAMPFITTGIFVGIILSYILSFFNII